MDQLLTEIKVIGVELTEESFTDFLNNLNKSDWQKIDEYTFLYLKKIRLAEEMSKKTNIELFHRSRI